MSLFAVGNYILTVSLSDLLVFEHKADLNCIFWWFKLIPSDLVMHMFLLHVWCVWYSY